MPDSHTDRRMQRISSRQRIVVLTFDTPEAAEAWDDLDDPRLADARPLLEELYEWALDACYQGAGEPITAPRWHMNISTWEDADDLLPKVAKFLGRPDPHDCDHDWRVFKPAPSYEGKPIHPQPDWCDRCGLTRPPKGS